MTVTYFSMFPSIYLGELRKATETLSQVNRSPEQDLNPRSPE
jgi:hypothetical protein